MHPVRGLADALAPNGARPSYTWTLLARQRRAVGRAVERSGEGDDSIDRLYAFSEGNALFLNEAIAHVVESTTTFDGRCFAIEGYRQRHCGRTALLSETARIVAEIAAICGQGCSVDVVRDVAGCPQRRRVGLQ